MGSMNDHKSESNKKKYKREESPNYVSKFAESKTSYGKMKTTKTSKGGRHSNELFTGTMNNTLDKKYT